jgi:hypothetical protein
MNRVHRGLVIVPVAALAVGCGTIRDMIKDMVHIQLCVRQQSGTQSVNVNVGTGKRFTIGLVNAPIDTLPAEARTAAARKVAECVRDNYHRYGRLNEVAVAFTHSATVGVAKVSTTTAPLVFTTKELGAAPAPSADSTGARAPARN